jgi:Cu/Ag efflux protein CusF
LGCGREKDNDSIPQYPEGHAMKISKKFIYGIAAVATVITVTPASADTSMHDMGTMQNKAAHSDASPMSHEGYGVLKAVNAAEGRIQLQHHEIPSLHWPAMTMWFDLRGALPKNVHAGDAVRFSLTEASPGKWVVTKIEPK